MAKPSINYSKICQDLIKDLPQRTKDVVLRRFALFSDKDRETLETVGKSYGITRERVRQIERDGMRQLGSKTEKYSKTFQSIKDYIKNVGGLKREDILLEQLGGRKEKNQVYFLLTLGKQFKRISESDDLHAFWTVDEKSVSLAQKNISLIYNKLEKIKKPFLFEKLIPANLRNSNSLETFLAVSKKIQKNSEGLFGLRNWPEINPRGVKDKAYLVFKREQKPLHFTEVAKLIDKSLPQTVHNELIKDQRFVLVGRGMYALQEWGYSPGFVKDIILKILKESKKPLTKEEILNKVLKQRMVKENTIFLNLNDKEYFSKTSDNCYVIREA